MEAGAYSVDTILTHQFYHPQIAPAFGNHRTPVTGRSERLRRPLGSRRTETWRKQRSQIVSPSRGGTISSVNDFRHHSITIHAIHVKWRCFQVANSQ